MYTVQSQKAVPTQWARPVRLSISAVLTVWKPSSLHPAQGKPAYRLLDRSGASGISGGAGIGVERMSARSTCAQGQQGYAFQPNLHSLCGPQKKVLFDDCLRISAGPYDSGLAPLQTPRDAQSRTQLLTDW